MDEHGNAYDITDSLPEMCKVDVQISDIEVLEAPKNGREAKHSEFTTWMQPDEVRQLIQAEQIIFDAGIAKHKGMLGFVRIHEYLDE